MKHPANHIDPSIVESVLNELVQRGVLVQTLEETREGQPIRTTRLDRSNPEVTEALTQGMPS